MLKLKVDETQRGHKDKRGSGISIPIIRLYRFASLKNQVYYEAADIYI
jgi:hypothetical protein